MRVAAAPGASLAAARCGKQARCENEEVVVVVVVGLMLLLLLLAVGARTNKGGQTIKRNLSNLLAAWRSQHFT